MALYLNCDCRYPCDRLNIWQGIASHCKGIAAAAVTNAVNDLWKGVEVWDWNTCPCMAGQA
ncbi:hypothetical protein M514_11331 [Trichuris suis]|uniref:Uncharacterized protein n=1 Tax=Trichuris suis TaxID=68888 RepID=A0A085MRW6_9BILA|nr:hypothetical protein M513_11331 [Trichuris suis]KFD59962.1 hypothetical protein M514_11331 [Trichuris suis]